MNIIDWNWKDMLSTKEKFMSNKQTQQHVDDMQDEFTDNDLDQLSNYFFAHYAKNNHDDVACDYWLSNLTEQEGRAILEAEDRLVKDIVEHDLAKLKEQNNG